LPHKDRPEPVLFLPQACHPERSGPAFFSAPRFGALGRAVEGSLLRVPHTPPSRVVLGLLYLSKF